MNDPTAEFGGGEDAAGVELEVAGEHGHAEDGAAAGVHFEADIHQLMGAGGFPIEDRAEAAAEEAVAFEEAPLIIDGVDHQVVGVALAEVEAAGVFELSGAGRAGDIAEGGDIADEPACFGDEDDGDAVAIGPGIHLHVGVAAGGEEPFDAVAHGAHAEGLVHLEGENLVELGGFEGLAPGIELDVANRQPLEFGGLGAQHGSLRNRHQDQGTKRDGQAAHSVHDSVSPS